MLDSFAVLEEQTLVTPLAPLLIDLFDITSHKYLL